MRRAWRRSARMRARVVLPTRRGPSITMKWGGCEAGCGWRARLAEEEAGPGMGPQVKSSGERDYSSFFPQRAATREGQWYEQIRTRGPAGEEGGTNRNMTKGPV